MSGAERQPGRLALPVQHHAPAGAASAATPPAARPGVGLLVRLSVGVLAGVLAVLGGAAPTGLVVWDAVLVAVPVALAVTAAHHCPWWLGVAFGAAVIAFHSSVWVACGAAITVACGLAAGLFPRARLAPALLTTGAFAGCVAAAHAGAAGSFGTTSLVAVVGTTALAMSGWAAASPPARRRVRLVLVVGGGALGVAVVFAAVAGLSGRADLTEGERLARQGLRAAQRGDMAQAASDLRAAAAAFDRVADTTTGVLLAPGRLVPGLAQHREALDTLASRSSVALREAAGALDGIDLGALTAAPGRVDLTSVAALQQPFERLAAAVDGIAAAIAEARDPWLIGPIQDQLTRNAAEVADRADDLTRARSTLALAPALLGADGPRRYFVAFVTPAERRGLVGFMGNWAELVVNDGRIEMTAFGQDETLNRGAVDSDLRTLDGPAEFLDLYGQFGFLQPDGTTGRVPWKLITMPPDLPTVGQVIAQLYPQSGGAPIDGVIVLDTHAIAELIRLTGPVRAEGLPGPITADTAEDFLLRGQYLIENPVRTDLLDAIARAVVEDLLGSPLPPTPQMARVLGPLVPSRSLMLWSTHPDEQALFAELGVDGSLDRLMGDGDIALAINNSAGNKIDAYLDVELTTSDGGATLTLHNTAPASGLPFYVIGNLVDLPYGTNRARLTIYTRAPIVALDRDGAAVAAGGTTELGWFASTFTIDLAAGDATTIEVRWAA